MSAHILLAEDNASNRYLATYLLKEAGFEVTPATNGRDALRLARVQTPDLILMDLQMPEMDGYEAARRIHEDPALAHVPIVALTAYAMDADRQKALESGFAGYLEKPIHTATFVAEVSHFLPQKPAHS